MGSLQTVLPFKLTATEAPIVYRGLALVALDAMWHFFKKSPAKSGSERLIVLIQDSSLIANVGIVIGPRKTVCSNA